jgi:sialate O-acetylesterase
MRSQPTLVTLSFMLAVALGGVGSDAGTLKTHRVFSSNMVIQRDKPIMIWGWAETGSKVTVQFGQETAEAAADVESGRWEVTFPARQADATGRKLTVTSGGETIELDNIVIGDVWVMNGQSNMAFGLGKVQEGDLEIAQAHLPLLRMFSISPNESYTLRQDLPDEVVSGWHVCTPETAGEISAIGHMFGARLQRALQIPIGIIDNARGGASIESLVPRHKFADHPLAARYLEWVEQRRAEFDWDAALKPLIEKWEKETAELRDKGVPEDQWLPRPTRDDLRSWNVPGRSPSDAASCYNGMFGVFKGLNIKGVLFHQGYNNAMSSACRPNRYRVLMKLMVEGWREDFNDPTHCPWASSASVPGAFRRRAVISRSWSVSPGAYIREAQRLGLADLEDPTNTAFLPAYDIQIPGLHPVKKQAHGIRAARWALNRIYGMQVAWDSASLVSAERDGDCMVLTFDKKVMPDDHVNGPGRLLDRRRVGKILHGSRRVPADERRRDLERGQQERRCHQSYCLEPAGQGTRGRALRLGHQPHGESQDRRQAVAPIGEFSHGPVGLAGE